MTSPPPVKPEPWKNSDRPMPRLVPCHCLRFCANCDRLTASRSTGSALASLPSFCPVAVVSPGRSALISRSRTGSMPSCVGDAIHVRFDRKLRLRRAEAAERAVRRRVRHHRAAANAHVIAPIRTGRVDHAARQHHRAQRRVGAAVHDHVDVHRRDAAVARQAGAMPHDRRMPLRRRQQILDAVVDHLHRPVRLARQDRGVAGEHRRVFFLAAKPAAGFGLHDAHAIGRQLQQHHQRLVHVVRALQRSVDGHLAVAGHGDHAVGFDVELLLMTGTILTVDHDIRDSEIRDRSGLCRSRSS